MTDTTDTPPTWTPIDGAAGLWSLERWNRKRWHWRATGLALPGGGSLVVGPLTHPNDDTFAALEAGPGRPAGLLAPNHYHYLAVPAYLEQYPDLVWAASAVAAPRVGKKLAGVVDRGPAELAALPALPAHTSLLEPPGLKNGEVWLRVETERGVAWVVSDAFFNLPANPGGGVGLICRLTGTTPGLRIGGTFTSLGIRDKPAYRDWLLHQLANDRPTRLIPGHGEILEAADLADRLVDLTNRRLG